MLGVVVLELGYKWKEELLGPRKEMSLTIIRDMAKLNNEMVFFRRFFDETIYGCILEVLENVMEGISTSSNYKNAENRIFHKVVEIFSLIPNFCFKVYESEKN